MAAGGIQANYMSLLPSLSGDGRYVAFNSGATNLVPGDTNGYWDVFVHDRETGTTTRVSVATDGIQANDESSGLHMSYDGRYVVFSSDATNLVPGDTNEGRDIFVHDRETETTTRVSVATDGIQANGESTVPHISYDGRYVAFSSVATNIVPVDTNGEWDVFVHDRGPLTGYGDISGIIRDSITYELINGAMVEATGGYVDTSTDVDGFYKIVNVPEGSGYTVTASALNYKSDNFSNVNVTEGNTTTDVDIYLQPNDESVIFELIPLVPNTFDRNNNGTPDDKEIMKVMQGGTIYRYYELIDSQTKDKLHGVPYVIDYGDDKEKVTMNSVKGLVKVPIEYYMIQEGKVGDISTVKITSINGLELTSPVDFQVEVIDRIYETIWDIVNTNELNVAFIDGQLGFGVEVKVEGTETIPDKLTIERSEIKGIGAGIGIGAGLSAEIKAKGINFKEGIYGGAGLNAMGQVEYRASYQFDYPSSEANLPDSLAQFALMNRSIIGSCSNTLLAMLIFIESTFDINFPNYSGFADKFLYGGNGIITKRSGAIIGDFSNFLLPGGVFSNIRLNAHTSLGGEYASRFRSTEYKKDGETFLAGASFDINGKAQADLNYGMNFSSVYWPLKSETFQVDQIKENYFRIFRIL